MKTPLVDQEGRQSIRDKTLLGANIEFGLAFQRLRRDIYRSRGYFAMKWLERKFLKALNNSLKPWWRKQGFDIK